MANFQSSDWEIVKDKCNTILKNHRDVLESPDKTYKEKLIAIGLIQAAKTILNLPQSFEQIAANKGNK